MAVDQVDVRVPERSVSFLGPNGAGKTTTIRLLLNPIKNPTTATCASSSVRCANSG
ncbi:MAG: hypothetical protein U0559_08050 [Anaerolineae bacterium]